MVHVRNVTKYYHARKDPCIVSSLCWVEQLCKSLVGEQKTSEELLISFLPGLVLSSPQLVFFFREKRCRFLYPLGRKIAGVGFKVDQWLGLGSRILTPAFPCTPFIQSESQLLHPMACNPNPLPSTGIAVPMGFVLHPAFGGQSCGPPQGRKQGNTPHHLKEVKQGKEYLFPYLGVALPL